MISDPCGGGVIALFLESFFGDLSSFVKTDFQFRQGEAISRLAMTTTSVNEVECKGLKSYNECGHVGRFGS